MKWHPECSPFKVADLIADIGNDRVALGFDLGPLRRFVRLHVGQIVAVGPRSKLGPTIKSLMNEIENGRIPLSVRAAGNENHGDAVGLCGVEQLPRGFNRPGARFEDPLIEPARTRRQRIAGAIGHKTKIVGKQIRPVGQ